MNGSVYRGYRFGFSAQFGPATHFGLGEIDGVQLTVVNNASKASILQQELSSLLQKGAIEEIPQSDIKRGFFRRYFLVPKRDGGLRPILDLRRLNFSLYKGKFKMLTMKTIMSQIQGGDWFVTIDLKDAYFHTQVVQRHRRFLRFAFGGKAYQYTLQEELLSDGFGCGLPQGDRLGVPGGVVDDHHVDVFVSPGRLRQQPHKVHPDALEGHLDDGKRYQRAGGRLLG